MFNSGMRVSVVVAGLVVGAASNLAIGATVSWGPVTTITANTDIVNPAKVVEARNYGNAATSNSVNVGGQTVVFTPASGINVNNRLIGNVALFDSTGTDVTPNFEAVLDSCQWDNTAPGVMSFAGLKDGGSYTLQVFSSDDRDNRTWKTTLTINGTSTTLDVTGKASVFATATIYLDPGETGFSVDVTYPSGGLWMINAVVLADIPPPSGTVFIIR